MNINTCLIHCLTLSTTPLSFRIDKSTKDLLQKEADERNVSLSYLINEILEGYTVFYSDSIKSKDRVVPTPVLKRLYEMLSEGSLEDVANLVFENTTEKLLKKYGKIPDDAIDHEFDLFCKFNHIDLQRFYEGDKSKYVLTHGTGLNWSKCLFLVANKLCNLMKMPIKLIEQNEDILIFSITK